MVFQHLRTSKLHYFRRRAVFMSPWCFPWPIRGDGRNEERGSAKSAKHLLRQRYGSASTSVKGSPAWSCGGERYYVEPFACCEAGVWACDITIQLRLVAGCYLEGYPANLVAHLRSYRPTLGTECTEEQHRWSNHHVSQQILREVPEKPKDKKTRGQNYLKGTIEPYSARGCGAGAGPSKEQYSAVI